MFVWCLVTVLCGFRHSPLQIKAKTSAIIVIADLDTWARRCCLYVRKAATNTPGSLGDWHGQQPSLEPPPPFFPPSSSELFLSPLVCEGGVWARKRQGTLAEAAGVELRRQAKHTNTHIHTDTHTHTHAHTGAERRPREASPYVTFTTRDILYPVGLDLIHGLKVAYEVRGQISEQHTVIIRYASLHWPCTVNTTRKSGLFAEI